MSEGAENRDDPGTGLHMGEENSLEFYRVFDPVIIFACANVELHGAEQFSADLIVMADNSQGGLEIPGGKCEAVFDEIMSRSEHDPCIGTLRLGRGFVGMSEAGAAGIEVDVGGNHPDDPFLPGAAGEAGTSVLHPEKGIEQGPQFLRIGRVASSGMEGLPHRGSEKRGNLLCREISEFFVIQKEVVVEGLDQILQILYVDQLAGLFHEGGLQISHRVSAVHFRKDGNSRRREDEVLA